MRCAVWALLFFSLPSHAAVSTWTLHDLLVEKMRLTINEAVDQIQRYGSGMHTDNEIEFTDFGRTQKSVSYFSTRDPKEHSLREQLFFRTYGNIPYERTLILTQYGAKDPQPSLTLENLYGKSFDFNLNAQVHRKIIEYNNPGQGHTILLDLRKSKNGETATGTIQLGASKLDVVYSKTETPQESTIIYNLSGAWNALLEQITPRPPSQGQTKLQTLIPSPQYRLYGRTVPLADFNQAMLDNFGGWLFFYFW